MADMIPVRWNKSVPAVRVRFIVPWSLYNAGETAGFTAEIAQSLVDAARARYIDPPPVLASGEGEQAPVTPLMSQEEELAALGVDTSTKEDSEEEMKRKALKRPPKDKMVKDAPKTK